MPPSWILWVEKLLEAYFGDPERFPGEDFRPTAPFLRYCQIGPEGHVDAVLVRMHAAWAKGELDWLGPGIPETRKSRRYVRGLAGYEGSNHLHRCLGKAWVQAARMCTRQAEPFDEEPAGAAVGPAELVLAVDGGAPFRITVEAAALPPGLPWQAAQVAAALDGALNGAGARASDVPARKGGDRVLLFSRTLGGGSRLRVDGGPLNTRLSFPAGREAYGWGLDLHYAMDREGYALNEHGYRVAQRVVGEIGPPPSASPDPGPRRAVYDALQRWEVLWRLILPFIEDCVPAYVPRAGAAAAAAWLYTQGALEANSATTVTDFASAHGLPLAKALQRLSGLRTGVVNATQLVLIKLPAWVGLAAFRALDERAVQGSRPAPSPIDAATVALLQPVVTALRIESPAHLVVLWHSGLRDLCTFLVMR
jgi:hypothetical protein